MIGPGYRRPMARTGAQTLGDGAESRAAADLEARGWRILARNVRAGRGELDVVAIDPGPPRHLVIVEVRWRASRGFGLAEETIDHRKRAHLRAAVGRLLGDGLPAAIVLPRLPVRVDLVVVEPGAPIRHHRHIEL